MLREDYATLRVRQSERLGWQPRKLRFAACLPWALKRALAVRAPLDQRSGSMSPGAATEYVDRPPRHPPRSPQVQRPATATCASRRVAWPRGCRARFPPSDWSAAAERFARRCRNCPPRRATRHARIPHSGIRRAAHRLRDIPSADFSGNALRALAACQGEQPALEAYADAVGVDVQEAAALPAKRVLGDFEHGCEPSGSGERMSNVCATARSAHVEPRA